MIGYNGTGSYKKRKDPKYLIIRVCFGCGEGIWTTWPSGYEKKKRKVANASPARICKDCVVIRDDHLATARQVLAEANSRALQKRALFWEKMGLKATLWESQREKSPGRIRKNTKGKLGAMGQNSLIPGKNLCGNSQKRKHAKNSEKRKYSVRRNNVPNYVNNTTSILILFKLLSNSSWQIQSQVVY